ncbi:hypothetical protein lerEdw1_021093, partial [Lerista edwardsae]
YLLFPDASKAAFMASPSSCFLANRNKAGTVSSDASVKNECLVEQAYFPLSTNQHSSMLNAFSAGNNENMQQLAEPLYQTVPPTNQNFYGVSANYPAMFRTQTHPSSGTYQHRAEPGHFTTTNDQRFPRDYFSSSCAVPPYSTRSPPNFGCSSTMQEAHGMQFLNSGTYNYLSNSVILSQALMSFIHNCVCFPTLVGQHWLPLRLRKVEDIPDAKPGIVEEFQARAGFYGNNMNYSESHRLGSMVDQHVSVISSISSIRPLPPYSDIHDPLSILEDTGRKQGASYYADASITCRNPLTSDMQPALPASSSQCMYGHSRPCPSQETIDSSGQANREMVSSLPPINTVFMGTAAGGT